MSTCVRGIRHLLLDIEGTTCPVSFVGETLFPYARQHLADYLQAHAEDAEVIAIVEAVQQLWQADPSPEAQSLRQRTEPAFGEPAANQQGAHGQLAAAMAVVPYLHWLIDTDRKATPLKDLQGRIWEAGYSNGTLITPLFEDVAPALKRFAAEAITLAVYSSGSVKAQQLLYGHSRDGDLRSFFQHWFDTRSGSKQEARSYQAISQAMAAPASSILFISDIAAELEAASTAGLRVLFSSRPGNPQTEPGRFGLLRSLAELQLLS